MWDDDSIQLTRPTKAEVSSIPETKYEYLDHPADVQIHAWGSELREAFEQCATAMFGYMTDLETVDMVEVKEVEAEAEDLEGFLFHFLDECLFIFSCDPYFIARKVVITSWQAGGRGGGGGDSGGEDMEEEEEEEEEEQGAGKEEKDMGRKTSREGRRESNEKEEKGEKRMDDTKEGGRGRDMKEEQCEEKRKKHKTGGGGEGSGGKEDIEKKDEEREEGGGGGGGDCLENDTRKEGRGGTGEEARREEERGEGEEVEEGGDAGGTGGEATKQGSSHQDGEDNGVYRIRAKLYGEEFQLDKHPQGTEVKAITYASMQIYDKPGQHEVFVIVDI